MTTVERLLATARAEVGYLEKASKAQLDSKTANAGSANYTKYARDLDKLGVYHAHKQGFAWCDIFVDWCFIQTFGLETGMKMTGQPTGGYGAGCTESARYYKQIGRFHRSGPQPGDQIFFTYTNGRTMAHTGIVERAAGGRVYTIEGNTSGASGVIANGGGVCRKSYPLDYARIGGYGRPDYSIVQEEDEEMDLERFKTLWHEMRQELQDNDSSGYSEKARAYFIEKGLAQGGDKLPDGSPNYMWEDVLTREQFVTVLYRLLEKTGLL